jgi:hypothetical protein
MLFVNTIQMEKSIEQGANSANGKYTLQGKKNPSAQPAAAPSPPFVIKILNAIKINEKDTL